MTGWMKQSLCVMARTDFDEQMTSELRNGTMEGSRRDMGSEHTRQKAWGKGGLKLFNKQENKIFSFIKNIANRNIPWEGC